VGDVVAGAALGPVGRLAFTGGDAGALAALGTLLVLLGGAVVVRRRRDEA